VEGFSFFLLHFICWPYKTSLNFGPALWNVRKRKMWHRESRSASSEGSERCKALRVPRCPFLYIVYIYCPQHAQRLSPSQSFARMCCPFHSLLIINGRISVSLFLFLPAY
jgi:hypothetical protein